MILPEPARRSLVVPLPAHKNHHSRDEQRSADDTDNKDSPKEPQNGFAVPVDPLAALVAGAVSRCVNVRVVCRHRRNRHARGRGVRLQLVEVGRGCWIRAVLVRDDERGVERERELAERLRAHAPELVPHRARVHGGEHLDERRARRAVGLGLGLRVRVWVAVVEPVRKPKPERESIQAVVRSGRHRVRVQLEGALTRRRRSAGTRHRG